MKIYTKLVFNMESGKILEEESFEYDGPIDKCDRAAQQMARTALNKTSQTADQYNAEGQNINSTLTPYLNRQLLNPIGINPKDIGAIQTNALAGESGNKAGIIGAAGKYATATRNPSGFSSALDSAARSGEKAASDVASSSAAENAKVKLGQSSDASKQLGSMYQTDTDASLKVLGLDPELINSLTKSGQSGWLQNMNDTIATLSGTAKAANQAQAG